MAIGVRRRHHKFLRDGMWLLGLALPWVLSTSGAGATGWGRELLASSSCGLQYQGSTLGFSHCQDLTAELEQEFNILWSFTPGAGEEGVLYMALDAPAPANSWVAFAIPETPGAMIGASAVIVKTDSSEPSGASAQQYLLSGYTPSSVKPGGILTVQNLTAAFAKGRLQAVFTLPKTASSEGSIAGLVAHGPLDTSGGLKVHTAMSGIMLNAAPVPPAAAAVPSAAAAVPPTAGTVLRAGATVPLAPSRAPVTGLPPVRAPATLPPAQAPTAASVGAAAAASIESQVTQEIANSPAGTANCVLTGQGAALAGTFDNCQGLTGATPDFTLLWKLNTLSAAGRRLQAAESAGGSKENVTLAVNVAKSDGWAAVGIPSTPGQMVGANAVFFRVCPSCPAGATADSRYLEGKSAAAVLGAGRLPVDGLRAWAEDGRLMGAFNVLLDPASVQQQALIFASGPVASTGAYQYHDDGAGAVFVNLLSGAVSDGGGELKRLKLAHGTIMAVAWGFLIPTGAVIARNFKTLGGTWYNIHRGMQTIGWLMGWAGLGIGVHITTGGYGLHHRLGLSVQILGSIQVLLALFAKPVHASRRRRLWNLGHWWVGRAAIALAIANVFIGMRIAKVEMKYVVAYSVVLGAIVVTAFTKETADYLSLPPPTEEWPDKTANYLSVDPIIAARPYAGLRFLGGRAAHPKGSMGSVTLKEDAPDPA